MALKLPGPPKPPVPGGGEWGRINSALGRVFAHAKKTGKYDQVIDAVWESIRTPKKLTSPKSILTWVGRNRGALILVVTAMGTALGAETVRRILKDSKVELPEIAPQPTSPRVSEDDLLNALDQITGAPASAAGSGPLAMPIGVTATAASMQRVKRLRSAFGGAAQEVVNAVRTVSAADFAVYDTLHPY